MKKKIIPILVMTLLITTFAIPVLGMLDQSEKNTVGKLDVTLDVVLTTDYINGWQDYGLRIKEYGVLDSVWVYSEFSGEDLFGINMTQNYYYDTGNGVEYVWNYWYVVDDHYESAYQWSYEPMGYYYGDGGYGYIEIAADGVPLGRSNWFAVGNTQPNMPTIDGEVAGKAGTEYEYTFTATDPEGMDVSYIIEWGCGETNTTDFVASGEAVKFSHAYAEGDYTIRAKAIDLVDNESEWADLEISMPITKEIKSPLLKFFEEHTRLLPLLRQILGL